MDLFTEIGRLLLERAPQNGAPIDLPALAAPQAVADIRWLLQETGLGDVDQCGEIVFTGPVKPDSPTVAGVGAVLGTWLEHALFEELPSARELARLIDAPPTVVELARRCAHGARRPHPYALPDGRTFRVRRGRLGDRTDRMRTPGTPCAIALEDEAVIGAAWHAGGKATVEAEDSGVAAALLARVALDTGRRTFSAADAHTDALLGDAVIGLSPLWEWLGQRDDVRQAALTKTADGVCLRGVEIPLPPQANDLVGDLLDWPRSRGAIHLGLRRKRFCAAAGRVRQALGRDGHAVLMTTTTGYRIGAEWLLMPDDAVVALAPGIEVHLATCTLLVNGEPRSQGVPSRNAALVGTLLLLHARGGPVPIADVLARQTAYSEGRVLVKELQALIRDVLDIQHRPRSLRLTDGGNDGR